MFIVTAAGPANPLAALWPAMVLAVGAAAAVRLGVFRRRSIEGPLRVTAEDSVEPLAIAALCGCGIYLMLVSLIHVPLPISTTQPSQQDSLEIRMLLPDMLARVAAVAIMIGILLTQFRQPRRLGFNLREFLPGLWRGALSILIVLPLMMLALVGTEELWDLLHLQGDRVHELLKLMGDVPDPRLRAVLLISVLVIAPISEEFFFRGCLQTWVCGWLARQIGNRPPAWPRWVAVIFTSFIFAAVHPWWSSPPIFVLSVCLGYAYERTGNLWVPIVIHAMFNGASVVDFFAQGAS